MAEWDGALAGPEARIGHPCLCTEIGVAWISYAELVESGHQCPVAAPCLDTAYGPAGLDFDSQHGAAMGSPVSPIVANLYMEHFEQLSLERALALPRLWLRYVDDTFTICLQDKIEELTDQIYSIDSVIKFTREFETDGQIAFLASLISLNQDGSLDLSVYRKPTHTNQYLKFSSHHPLHQKLGGCAYSQTSL